MEYTTLKDGFTFPKIINGMWQVTGGHGKINYKNALNDMVEYISSGLNTFDMADHYGPAEDLYGEVLVQVRKGEVKLNPNQTSFNLLYFFIFVWCVLVVGFTKWFPRPGVVTLESTTKAINRAASRMKLDKIELLQFHWWDYDDERYIDALKALVTLKNQSKPLISHIGLTNFDTKRLQIIKESIGIENNIVTNQVSYSIIDRRCEKSMVQFCNNNDIYIIAYGVCLGGLISEKFLGVPEPSQVALNTWSLQKYRDYVERWGGWRLFQDLLEVLKKVGNKHGVSLTVVAIRYILDKPRVGALVIGCRWGITKHIDDLTMTLFSFSLDKDDLRLIESIVSKGDTMLGWTDCGDEYR
ncbi:hypothetical protein PPL_04099 [Heterostelium album PN500]|uniref:NADP-dependent oxidoreductase domain-containing protein n=1 Tax=Heterostelium pallidum (strain ATCC 26659 / Pp 5 / PN500) TaxID=670386 RepID=D3B611_HETP5|nr:hypothetical protein PPL_04099 [Heterostelium album PN500]EFA83309.1 hypothetical protein PPL_04099 [Heterostelium album PN500]|eukprot:XP_020435426.1 hypothetical protein PPL_04099 [Heterostelium album PN500]